MTIDKAIEILTHWREELHEPDKCDAGRAFQLGIEALEEIKIMHERGLLAEDDRLPGEVWIKEKES